MQQSQTENTSKSPLGLYALPNARDVYSNVQLLKDRGLIPYAFHKQLGLRVVLVSANREEHPYLEEHLKGITMEFADPVPNDNAELGFIYGCLNYIRQNSEKMDVLFLFGAYMSYRPMLELYRSLRPDGKVYLKLDINSSWLDKMGCVKDDLYALLAQVDVISAECRRMQRALCRKWPFPVVYVPNGYYPYFTIRPVDYSEKENIILTVGRIGTGQKNNETMLLAFALASVQIQDWQLRLVGTVEPSFQEFVDEFFEKFPQMRGKVVLTGPIYDKAKLWGEYRRAKVFALSSRVEGGAPNVYMESAISGCCCITSDFDAAPDMAGDGKYGEVFPVGDYRQMAQAMVRLCSDEARMRDICGAIQQYMADYYDYAKIVEKLALRLHISSASRKGEGTC